MIRIRFGSRPRAALVAVAIALATATSLFASDKQQEKNDATPFVGIKNIVLVHGAWADGSCWAKVIPLLKARGMNVVAVQNPLTSLADDVATTLRTVANLEGPVLLVGHSYGGTVITQAGNDPKVVGLVYVAAFAPDAGESTLALLMANPTPIASELVFDPLGFVRISPKGIREAFAQDLTATEQDVLTATQGPTSGATGAPATSISWKTKPSWYLVATQDRTIAPQLQHFFADRMSAKTRVVQSSHLPMLSKPQEVASFIRKAAVEAAK